ncbi:hypothetical protein A3K34_02470 [candidate division WWE3 bacterium RIFOXYC1_FULL_40_10]|uniref:Short-chain dehydrogenase n=1 Tax=candidate division WWE3 bacterium RIFOXYA2_FULL_46_9 TaxID=1802636 RepID=A0A1F4W2Q0_UNCKA|nr:MAG: hypothetical protein A3K58_02470 [candidate division WWE3 bacterium RIFOXYB1_FULL_40_22]OGC61715.1 MAG: hypothetical protein A3K37_02470 [candidate division WWE3 bacterium RIFOXYA1_FULL_40_11]OGC63699.1 MAG: hypothetical protein A2264_04960 [candidate division WWE3 bacterium RIFOXYA2_FULL_46_9]OGC64889.1 MAG: hypothetical protein A2326_01295 [candidate division WWE3 bacterium RIFOXYB2_FULL_41_6]OGC66098.1 MAG: hypothetical protein A3K34_02470 [candidate division WWE3 bacterium RIFOXYC1_
MIELEKKVVLITGGSDGLGLEIAEFLNQKHTVVITSNDKTKLCEIGDSLCCDNFYCDVSDPGQIEDVVSQIVARHKKIDVLINNAGIWLGGDLVENTYQDVARVIMVNTVGTIYMTKAVLPIMKRNKRGKIVNIVSVNGIEAKEERCVYISSKWAITGFTKALRKDLQKDNISVVGLYPGLMKTSLHETAGAKRDFKYSMDPKEVAKLVDYVIDQDDFVIEQLVFRDMNNELN